MKYYPIIFQPDMVNAIINGKKTQTRRLPTFRNSEIDAYNATRKEWERLDWCNCWSSQPEEFPIWVPMEKQLMRVEPRIQVGDVLWVKEIWKNCSKCGLVYKADAECNHGVQKWKSSLFMRKLDSRLHLKITGRRHQKIRSITVQDVFAEGCPLDHPREFMIRAHCDVLRAEQACLGALVWMRKLWENINKKKIPWLHNPRVWVYEFEVHQIKIGDKWI